MAISKKFIDIRHNNHHLINKLKNNEGDPVYDSKEDVYAKSKIVESVSPEEELSDELDEDLDVPGSDLDDQDESVGEEDEENNYYSIGGEDHDDIDEENTDEVDK